MMKKIYSVLSVLLTIILMGVFVSCERDKEVMLTAVSVTNEQITPMYKSATISSTISSEATIRDVFVQYTVTKDFAEYDEVPMQEKDGIYTAELIDLLDNTTYYYRYAASNRHSAIVLQKIQQFATLQPTAPVIRLDSILTVWDSYAQVQVALEFDGGASVTDMGICWGTQANLTIEDIHKSTKDTVAVLDIPSLQPNTQYYVRAYAVNKVGVAYSEEKEFTTLALPEVRTEDVSDIQVNCALLSATLVFNGNDTTTIKGFCWSDKSEPTIEGDHIAIDTASAGYTYALTALLSETQYFVRAYAQNKVGIVYGEEVSFTTKEQSSTPNNGTENGYAYVDLGLSVKWATCNVGATKPEEYGDYFAWGETEPKDDYDWSTYKWCNGSPTSLTKYNTNSSYGTVDNKTTLDLSDDAASANWGGSWRMPTRAEQDELRNNCTWTWTTQNGVNGYKVTSKSNGNSIFLPAAGYRNGSSLDIAGSNGLYWSSSLYADGPYSAYYLSFDSSRVGRYSLNRYCGHSVRPVWGEYVMEETVPTIITTTVTQITETSAVAGGNVTSDGNASVTERGVCIATVSNPTTSNTKITAGSGTGSFTCNLTGLQPNTTYYVRAYAINEKGTAYGDEVRFTTKEQSSTPNNGTENGYAYVDLGLSVKWATMNVGASKAEEYGDYFAWGETTTKSTYDWSTYKHCNGSATLLTKYNNSSSDGIVDNKTTLELSDDAAHVNWGGSWRMPTDAEWTELREQCTWTWTTQNGVYGRKVTSKTNENSIFLPAAGYRGGSSLLDAGSGRYWSSSLYTDRPDYALGVLFYSSDVYRYSTFRYSGNSVRPVLGENEVEVTTPTVTTATVTQITETTAVAGGNVTSDGNASVTERGVVYATTQNPTTNNTKVTRGSGTGSFTCNLTDLQPNTTYYVRAYAVNSKGTAYGEQVSFTTSKTVVLPSVTTSTVTQITETTAVAGGNVTADGNASVTDRGVCIATVSNPTTSNTKITAGSGTGSFTCNLTGLQANTTYYVRAYAVNSKGTAYGEQVSFTTQQQSNTPPTDDAIIFDADIDQGNASTDTNNAAAYQITKSGVTMEVSSGVIAIYNNEAHYRIFKSQTLTLTSTVGNIVKVEFTCTATDDTKYGPGCFTVDGGEYAYSGAVGTWTGAADAITFTASTNQVRATQVAVTIIDNGTENGTENGYAYVDLGLSVKWATMNVGASKAEEYGDYFAWGETQPKSTYDWSMYKYCNGSSSTLTKYCNMSSYGNNGFTDNKTQLDLSDDAARVNWGGAWRMPTDAEWTELREQCTWTWTTQNGKNGYKVTSKKSGYTNNSIFLPATGCRLDSSLNNAGSFGYYCSSSLNTGNPGDAWGVHFNSSLVYRSDYYRYLGRSVRPVCP